MTSIMEFVAVGCFKKKYYLWNDETHICCNCTHNLPNFLVLQTFKHKVYSKIFQKTYCLRCWEKIKEHNFEGNAILVTIDFPLPKNIIPIPPDTFIPESGGNASGFGKTLSDEDINDDLKNGIKLIRSGCKYALNPDQSMMDLPDYCGKYKEIEKFNEKGVEVKEIEDKVMDDEETFEAVNNVGAAKPYSWADQDREEEVLEEIKKLDEEKHGRRLLK
jgi:hypothetical protein